MDTQPTPSRRKRVSITAMPSNGALTNTSSSRHIFPFEKLAPELRNQIYELVLVGEHPIQISRFVDQVATREKHKLTTTSDKCELKKKKKSPASSARHSCHIKKSELVHKLTSKIKVPEARNGARLYYAFGEHYNVNILLLNKCINKESKGLLYGLNRFVFLNPGVLKTFTDHLPDAGRMVMNITIREVSSAYIWSLSKLHSLRSLGLQPSDTRGRLSNVSKWTARSVLLPLAQSKISCSCKPAETSTCDCVATVLFDSLSPMLRMDMGKFIVCDSNIQSPGIRRYNEVVDRERLMRLLKRDWANVVRENRQYRTKKKRRETHDRLAMAAKEESREGSRAIG
jgi:hypothetical protein